MTMVDENPDRLGSTELVSLKDALEMIPEFNGKNISVSAFVEGCEEARAMVSKNAEPNLSKLVKIKLLGEARRAVSGQTFSSIKEFTDCIKGIYMPTKSVNELQGEYAAAYQKDGEDVINYANRLRVLGKLTLEAYEMVSRNDTDLQTFTELNEKDLARCFRMGLRDEIYNHMPEFLNTKEALRKALAIENELISRKTIRSKDTPIQIMSTSAAPKATRVSNVKVAVSKEIKCQICFGLDHEALDCVMLVNQTLVQNQNLVTKPVVKCQICSGLNHEALDCVMLINQTPVKNQNLATKLAVTCKLCGSTSHLANSCFKNPMNQVQNSQQVQNNPRFPVPCTICGKLYHDASTCFKNPLYRAQNPQMIQGNSRLPVTCQICFKPFHSAPNCYQNPLNKNARPSLTCTNCFRRGHTRDTCYQLPENVGNEGFAQNNTCNYCHFPGLTISNYQKKAYNDNLRSQNQQASESDLINCIPIKPGRVIRVATVNLSHGGRVPTIQIKFDSVPNPVSFILDSGSGLNLIKESAITEEITVNRDEILQLSGITTHLVKTMGQIGADIFGHVTTFHLVPDNFPIPQSGILGSEFFEQTGAKINYVQNKLEIKNVQIPFASSEIITVPAKSISTFNVRVSNPQVQEGYLPEITVGKQINLGNVIAANDNGKAYMGIINARKEDVEIQVPTLELQLFDEVTEKSQALKLCTDNIEKQEQINNSFEIFESKIEKCKVPFVCSESNKSTCASKIEKQETNKMPFASSELKQLCSDKIENQEDEKCYVIKDEKDDVCSECSKSKNCYEVKVENQKDGAFSEFAASDSKNCYNVEDGSHDKVSSEISRLKIRCEIQEESQENKVSSELSREINCYKIDKVENHKNKMPIECSILNSKCCVVENQSQSNQNSGIKKISVSPMFEKRDMSYDQNEIERLDKINELLSLDRSNAKGKNYVGKFENEDKFHMSGKDLGTKNALKHQNLINALQGRLSQSFQEKTNSQVQKCSHNISMVQSFVSSAYIALNWKTRKKFDFQFSTIIVISGL